MRRCPTLPLGGCSLVEFTPQSCICFLEIEDHVDTGQVEAVLQKLTYQPETLRVVLAIEARPAIAPCRSDKPSSLVETEILRSITDQQEDPFLLQRALHSGFQSAGQSASPTISNVRFTIG